MVNEQKPERVTSRDDGFIEVVDVWHTIQGEGPFAGKPAVFVRLAGCNLQCPFCDTDYTSHRHTQTIDNLIQTILKCRLNQNTSLVVITGGEPFRQVNALRGLLSRLMACGLTIQIETNGTLPCDSPIFSAPRVYVVCSPKTPRVVPSIARIVCAYKYVVQADSIDPEDGLPITALGLECHSRVARPPEGFKGDIYVQPADEGDAACNERNTKAAVTSCMGHGYRLCLQVHKIVGLA